MYIINTLDFLYLVLAFFATIIGTLLVIVLLRLNKILYPLTEIADLYKKIKQIITLYKEIPNTIKEKITERFSQKENDTQN